MMSIVNVLNQSNYYEMLDHITVQKCTLKTKQLFKKAIMKLHV